MPHERARERSRRWCCHLCTKPWWEMAQGSRTVNSRWRAVKRKGSGVEGVPAVVVVLAAAAVRRVRVREAFQTAGP